VKKSDREIMEILEAFDVTGVAHSAADLCGVDPKIVRRYARARDLGRPVAAPVARPKLIDPFLEKIEEWVDRSKGRDLGSGVMGGRGARGRPPPRSSPRATALPPACGPA
jgi:hypothetical protein